MGFMTIYRNALNYLLPLIILFVGISTASQVKAECVTRDNLKLRTGHYARKTFWDMLPNIKIWSEAMVKFNEYATSAIEISTNGDLQFIDGWHEGSEGACVRFQGNELWAKKPYESSPEWVGPFIHVGLAKSDSVIYFDRIFGDRCYISTAGERWCFKSGSILIDGKQYKAECFLDTSEMPIYGTPVSIEKMEGFWVFVPTDNGWKIFQDTFVTLDGHKEIDPKKSLPWRTLKRLPTK